MSGADWPTLALALAIEAACGYPDLLFRRVRHPVVWMGALIGALDRFANSPGASAGRRRAAGGFALLVVLLAFALPAWWLQWALWRLSPALGCGTVALLASSLLAQRSLALHVGRVAICLEDGDLGAARGAVAHIVGRNPQTLDRAGVARAALESLAENFSDAVVAPALWLGLLGLPGIVAYKAINTADSMIGHLTPRHAAFGWAAARVDDLVNLPASRLAAAWLGLAALTTRGADARAAWRAVARDARRHRSPNAGWPEAAMAGALGLSLAGPRVYGSERVEDHWMGAGRRSADAADLRRGLSLYRRACLIQFLAVLLISVAAAAPPP